MIFIGDFDINVTIVTSGDVAVHVRTTKKKLYTFDPYFCNNKFNISAYSHKNEQLNEKGHKFRFEGIIIP